MGEDSQTYAVIGAAMAVHRELGHGFLEVVYQQALEREFQLAKIPYEREKSFQVTYKSFNLGCSYKADFVCFDDVLTEVKAIKNLDGPEEAQIINYLKVSGCSRGLLINFGAPSLVYRRFVDQSV